MNSYLTRITTALAVGSLLVFSDCSEDPPLPDNKVNFEAAQLGIEPSSEELVINVNLVRGEESAKSVILNIETNGVTYGTEFTTDPAPSGHTLTLTVPAGAVSTSFKVVKAQGAHFDGNETITFTIDGVSTGLKIGETFELTVTFSEILSAAGEMEIIGGGATYPNKVFIDLSTNRQTSVARNTWDLGFFSGEDFRVILNSSNGMMARALTKTNLASVTAADTVGFGAQLSIGAVFNALVAAPSEQDLPEWVLGSADWIDDPTGDLANTAIAPISATIDENKVYIINRGSGPGANPTALGWKKVRIIRDGSNYTVQHADIGSATYTEIHVTKDASHRFQYVNFGTGLVTVEPEATKWDIAWTAFTNTTGSFGPGTTLVPYYFQDVILQNRSGVETVQVLEATKAYEAFAEADLAALQLSNSQISIGSSWRSGGGPNSSPSIRADRYYIIKDPDGNYYKLKFTALTTNGERGKPQFKYALVKKAS